MIPKALHDVSRTSSRRFGLSGTIQISEGQNGEVSGRRVQAGHPQSSWLGKTQTITVLTAQIYSPLLCEILHFLYREEFSAAVIFLMKKRGLFGFVFA